jgi:hypothetical protein
MDKDRILEKLWSFQRKYSGADRRVFVVSWDNPEKRSFILQIASHPEQGRSLEVYVFADAGIAGIIEIQTEHSGLSGTSQKWYAKAYQLGYELELDFIWNEVDLYIDSWLKL